ncbi:MAG TPA: hypothetical protein VFB80_06160 [Pirellulaceae bacterium]|nr:hypothetical protein [Pirellulaceae bacterium]
MRRHDTKEALYSRAGMAAIELAVLLGGVSVGLLFFAASGVIVFRTLNQKPQVIAQVPQVTPPVVATPTTNPPTPAVTPVPPQVTPPAVTPPTPPATTPPAPASRIGNLELTFGPGVDVLHQGPITKHDGQFKLDSTGLATDATGPCKLEFPCELTGNYLIEINFTRLSGTDSLNTQFNIGGHDCSFVLDGFSERGGASGIDMVDVVRPLNRRGAVKGLLVTNGSPSRLRLAIVENRMIAELNGRVLEDWSGDPARLRLYVGGEFGQPHRLRLVTWHSGYQITRIEMTPIVAASPAGGASSSPPLAGTAPPPPAPTPSAVFEQLGIKVGEPINLLQRVSGSPNTFRREASQMVTEERVLCKLTFLTTVPESYVVQARVKRNSPLESIAISFPLAANRGAWVIDGWKPSGGPFSGLEMIDGRRVNENPTRVSGQQIADGKLADLLLVVLPGRIVSQIDGKQILDWKGNPSQLSETAFTKISRPQHVGIVTHFASYTIESALLYPITDAGQLLAAAPQTTPMPPATTPIPPPATNPPAAANPPAVAQAKRLPVPDEAAQKPIRDNLASVFGDRLAKAKKPEERAALAREMADVVKSEPDATTQYVLLTAARKTALNGLDFSLAMELAVSTAAKFDVEPVALRLETLTQAAALAGSNPDAHKSLAELAGTFAEETLAGERYDVADTASKLASDAGIKSKDADSRRASKELRDEVLAEKKMYDATQAALETLKTQPKDAASNLVVGKYYSLAREDWARALPHLAAGGDPALSPAAEAEQQAKDAPGQLAAAEKWQAAANAAKGPERADLARHALALCDAALPQLSGLPKVRAEKCQGELQTLIADSEKSTGGTAAATTRRTRSRSGKLEPGLIVRTYRGDLSRPSAALSIVMSSDEYYQRALDAVKTIIFRGYPNDYYLPVAMGYIVLDQPGTVELELENCTCLVNGAKFAEETGSTSTKVKRPLSKGRHLVAFTRAGSFYAPKFNVTLEGSDKPVLYHAPQDLKIELARCVYVNGDPYFGMLVYRTPQK